MALHPLAGSPVPNEMLTPIPALVTAYFSNSPNPDDPRQLVSFGTSGHRGSSLDGTFTESHILAITQAIVLYRTKQGIDGPLFLGMDTHALSEPAHATAVEVLAANAVNLVIAEGHGYTPTPVISHAILTHNRNHGGHPADGIIITPSHNPPTAGGIKYNPPNGGPADTDVTDWIAAEANRILLSGNREVRRMPLQRALALDSTTVRDFITPYVADLQNIVDMEAIHASGLRIAADALGGSGLGFWEPIAERYGLDITCFNTHADPTFGFMSLDHDGKVRMDCSSPYAMASLIRLKDNFDIAFGNDPDFDRHGIVTRSMGLMNPNHYLAVAVDYLFRTRGQWSASTAVGKTLVSSSMIDRVARRLGRDIVEVPVGFKWFVDGLLNASLGFGGEESAGASFLRKDGTVWSTDKDGFILALLAAEITATTGKDPAQHYADLEREFGSPVYERADASATAEQRKLLKNLSAEAVPDTELAGEPILAKLTRVPGNGASIEGLKVVTENGWFAARPSGTEDIYKIYAESFRGREHLKQLQNEARRIVSDCFRRA